MPRDATDGEDDYMLNIGTIGAAAPIRPITPTRPAEDGDGGDALAPMRAAMDTAFAIGQPTDKEGAAAILGTGTDFIAGARTSIGKLDEQMQQRGERLATGAGTPAQQSEDVEQLRLMKMLRDRIQQSLEHTIALLSDDGAGSSIQRAAILAPAPRAEASSAIDPQRVADAYANRLGDAPVRAAIS